MNILVIGALAFSLIGTAVQVSTYNPTSVTQERILKDEYTKLQIEKRLNLAPTYKTTPNVVQILAPNGSYGSGAVISSDGYILTAAHVAKLIEANNYFTIKTSQGSWYEARIIDINDNNDTAVLKINDVVTDLPFLLVSKDKMKRGDMAHIWGYSGGTLREKKVKFKEYSMGCGDTMVMSPGIDHGDSGGPILNDDGQIVGVGVAFRSSTHESLGVSVDQCRLFS